MPVKSICLSHSPFLGIVSPGEEVEADVRAQIDILAKEVEAYAPDLVILVAPDHFNGFFYDMMPPFCIGTRAESVGDYDTPAGPISVPEDEALAMIEALSAENFDITVSFQMQVDHAFAQPLQLLTGSLTKYPVIPLFINSAAPPRPSFRRVRALGEALGRYAKSLDKKVLMIGSGGLSHDPPVPLIKNAAPEVEKTLISGRNPTPEARAARQERTLQAGQAFAAGNSPLRPLNDTWDRDFLAILQSGDLARFDAFEDDWVTEQAGRAGHETRTWAAVFAAQSVCGPLEVEVLYQRAIPEWIVGMAMARA